MYCAREDRLSVNTTSGMPTTQCPATVWRRQYIAGSYAAAWPGYGPDTEGHAYQSLQVRAAAAASRGHASRQTRERGGTTAGSRAVRRYGRRGRGAWHAHRRRTPAPGCASCTTLPGSRPGSCRSPVQHKNRMELSKEKTRASFCAFCLLPPVRITFYPETRLTTLPASIWDMGYERVHFCTTTCGMEERRASGPLDTPRQETGCLLSTLLPAEQAARLLSACGQPIPSSSSRRLHSPILI